MKRLLSIAALGMLAPPALAHPHVFVDTALRFEIDENARITGVTMTWAYDDFFSLLILEDMGLDPDGDGVLTEAELQSLHGFDLVEWPDGFEGDLYIFSHGDKIEMPRPEPIGVAIEDGRIVSVQYREIPAVPAEGLEILQYDPTYYVAYTVSQGISFTAPDCAAQVTEADRAAAEAEVEKELGRSMDDIFDEMEVGIHFADRISVTCSARSN
ncbi:DUF1007 family protein [Marivita sp. GX14005]|uniref:DUF1007 family protein n=1 Tax=Marivita sp. GX14005 TaxID=2942276 RepID=UPI002018B314|nr:DUF1007 family protein [Marivita sp. GX14005]MCL3880915.1 DUF1007 family protein [Marivita sp. GX14005]